MELSHVARALGTTIHEVRPVPGGDINETYLIRTANGPYFLKWNVHPPSGFFQTEARGLSLLRQAQRHGGPRLPRPITHGPQFLVLEWIETARRTADERLGRELAALHRRTAESYGLDQDNYIGSLPQPNHRHESWLAFYAEERLQAQARLAERRGAWSAGRQARLDRVCGSLGRWLVEEPPALIHGDLWAGNVLVAATGEPVLVDPAPYYGSRELDLAMSELFGGFSPAFYAAYGEAYPQAPEWEARRPLYQLYFLLVHLVLFGQGYGRRVDAILARYGS